MGVLIFSFILFFRTTNVTSFPLFTFRRRSATGLCLKYDEKARFAKYQYFKSNKAEEAEELGIDVELAALDAKLRGSGGTFHRACTILLFACVRLRRCHGHVMDQLSCKGRA